MSDVMSLHIQNAHCASCVRRIERTIARLDQQAQVQVDLPAQRVDVRNCTLAADQIAAALTDAGYPAVLD